MAKAFRFDVVRDQCSRCSLCAGLARSVDQKSKSERCPARTPCLVLDRLNGGCRWQSDNPRALSGHGNAFPLGMCVVRCQNLLQGRDLEGVSALVQSAGPGCIVLPRLQGPVKKVIARMRGGLGNQLFCYAAARRLALVNDAELVIDDVTGFARDRQYRRRYALDRFRIAARKATPAERLEPFERYRRGLMK